jgi:hypothetical protein
LVSTLKLAPSFKNVDSLSADRRRGLADTNVVLADHHFALEIELKDSPFRPAEPTTERKPGGPTRTPGGGNERSSQVRPGPSS